MAIGLTRRAWDSFCGGRAVAGLHSSLQPPLHFPGLLRKATVLTLGAGGGAAHGLLGGVEGVRSGLLHTASQGLWMEWKGVEHSVGLRLCVGQRGWAGGWQRDVRAAPNDLASGTAQRTCAAPTAAPAAYAAPSPAPRAVSPAAAAAPAAVSRAVSAALPARLRAEVAALAAVSRAVAAAELTTSPAWEASTVHEMVSSQGEVA